MKKTWLYWLPLAVNIPLQLFVLRLPVDPGFAQSFPVSAVKWRLVGFLALDIFLLLAALMSIRQDKRNEKDKEKIAERWCRLRG